MLRKSLKAVILITFTLLILKVNVFASEQLSPEQYSDLPLGWSREAITNAINNGFLYGYDNKIYPKGYLTRSQLAAVVNRVYGTSEMADISRYVDVIPNAWYEKDIAYAVYNETMVGSGYQIFPERDATREEAFVVLARAMNIPTADTSALEQYEDYNQISHWAVNDLAAMVEGSYMHGANGKLQPKTKITREEFAYVIDQISDHHFEQISNQPALPPEAQQDISNVDNPPSDAGEVILNKSQSAISNQTINGDIIINEGIDGGEFSLDSVTLSGKIVINNGVLDTITISNSTINGIELNKEEAALKINNSGGAIDIISVKGNYSDISLNGFFNKVEVTAFSSIVSLTDNSTVILMNVLPSAYYSQFSIVNNSNALDFALEAPGSSVTITDNSTLSNLMVSNNAEGSAISLNDSLCELLDVSAVDVNISLTNSAIEGLSISEAAVNTVLEVDSSSSIHELDDRGKGTIR